jgi:dTDP-4-amino-4,6-dideoxygalactose transaminase
VGEKVGMAKLSIKGGKAVRNRPFSSWPIWGEKEQTELFEVLKSGNWSYHARKHEKQTEFAEKFARFQDAKYGVCTSSGAAALEVSLKAAGVEAGDEVIVPALTFVATASAALLIGAVPVFVDVDPDNYCLDVGKVREALTERTKAVVPVHLYCSIADMDELMRVAETNGLAVVEDCAHVPGSKWRGKGVGSIGTAGCFSFQQSKIMTAGEGGMIITSDDKVEERCTSLVDCGRIRKDDKYARNALGWNYRMTEFQAAVLLGQLESLPSHIHETEENAEYLSGRLRKIDGIRPLEKDEKATRQSYYYYVFRYDKNGFAEVPRDRFMAALFFEGIPCETIYEPVYKSALFTMEADKWPLRGISGGGPVDYYSVSCPVAEKASFEEAVAIPHVVLLGTREDADDVVAAVEKIRENASELNKADSALLKVMRAFRRYAPQALRHPGSIGDILGELRG